MNSSSRHLPNFFVVGAPKAGTTSLYHYLSQHPEIYMSPVKEPNYFASEIRPENLADELRQQNAADRESLREYLRGPMKERRFGGMVTEWDDYLRLFDNVGQEKAIGEASVCYLWSRTAAHNTRNAVGQAKIIMILRHPVERAFSQYLDCLAGGSISGSFAKHVQQAAQDAGDKFTIAYPLLEFGLYYEQVRRYLEEFGETSVMILLYEDYTSDLSAALRRIYRFLEVDPAFSADLSKRFHESYVPRFPALRTLDVARLIKRVRGQRLQSALRWAAFSSRESLATTDADRDKLNQYYSDDVYKLAVLLKRDLSSWLR